MTDGASFNYVIKHVASPGAIRQSAVMDEPSCFSYVTIAAVSWARSEDPRRATPDRGRFNRVQQASDPGSACDTRCVSRWSVDESTR